MADLTSDSDTRNFPLPQKDHDPKFTFGLVKDVAAVLEQHGYPPVTGTDHAALMTALYRFLYVPRDHT